MQNKSIETKINKPIKKVILDRINEIIEEEKGKKVSIKDTLKEAELDSLGTTIFISTIGEEFNLFSIENPDELFNKLIQPSTTIRELTNLCRSQTINIYME